jgi:hypothetical protein
MKSSLEDPVWRIGSIYLIQGEEGGRPIPFVLRAEQREFLEHAHPRSIIIKTRKLGFSTLSMVRGLDGCLTNPNYLFAVLDLTQKKAEEKLAMARTAYLQGPNHLDPVIARVWHEIHKRVKIVRDNDGEIRFSNGSRIVAGITFRGGTPQEMLISEFGAVACEDPKRADEIVSGAIGSVPMSGRITIETTFKGGRFGQCYRIAKLAQDAVGSTLTPLDWDFFFFAWWEHPGCVMEGDHHTLNGETLAYFRQLQEASGFTVSRGRMAWWERMKAVMGEAMSQEYPTTVEEVFSAKVPGAIYPIMQKLRAEGRLSKDVHPEAGPPLFSSWDLGVSDFMSGWVVQPAGRELLVLRWERFNGQSVATIADTIRRWGQELGRPIHLNFLPHDGGRREIGSGLTIEQQLVKAGIPQASIRIVPRTPNVWTGIGVVRNLLSRAYFDKSCDREVKLEDGTVLPSGVGALEAYRKAADTSSGVIREMPVHDVCSHDADGFRTFAEAWSLGLVPTMENRAGFTVRREAGYEARTAGGIRVIR